MSCDKAKKAKSCSYSQANGTTKIPPAISSDEKCCSYIIKDDKTSRYRIFGPIESYISMMRKKIKILYSRRTIINRRGVKLDR